jgi:hypothetical protein
MLKVLHGEGLRGPRTPRIELRSGINYFRTFDGSALWRMRSLDRKTWVAVDRSGWREHIWETLHHRVRIQRDAYAITRREAVNQLRALEADPDDIDRPLTSV